MFGQARGKGKLRPEDITIGLIEELFGLKHKDFPITEEQFESARKAAVRKWHPDLNKAVNAQEKFIQCQEAYEIIKPRLAALNKVIASADAVINKQQPKAKPQEKHDRSSSWGGVPPGWTKATREEKEAIIREWVNRFNQDSTYTTEKNDTTRHWEECRRKSHENYERYVNEAENARERRIRETIERRRARMSEEERRNQDLKDAVERAEIKRKQQEHEDYLRREKARLQREEILRQEREAVYKVSKITKDIFGDEDLDPFNVYTDSI